MHKIIPVLAIFAMLLCPGCQKTARHEGVASPDRTDTLIASLQRLPAVENVGQWDGEYGKGLLITTAHYEIYTTLLDPLMLTKIPAFMECAYQGYQKQLPKPLAAVDKMTVYLFATRTQWDEYTTANTGQMSPLYLKIKAGAYYLDGNIVAYNIGITKTMSVLGHEGWHQFANVYFKYKLPSWLDEGIATLFETSKYEAGQWVFTPEKNSARLGALKVTLVTQKRLPISDIIGLNPGQVLLENDQAVSAFYAQSYALVRFLREEDYGRRLGNFQKMLMGAVDGSWRIDGEAQLIASDKESPMTVVYNSYLATKLFGMYITNNTPTLEKPYTLFCNKITYRMQLTARK